jgi:RNA polymerase sigma-70 factor (ECF subfamily)
MARLFRLKQASTHSADSLVRAAQRGDVRAFEALYHQHAKRLMPMLWRLAGGDNSQAEDWLQEVFVQAWQKIAQVREAAAFSGWLRRIAANIALNERRRGGLSTVDVEAEAVAPAPPWPAADVDLERAIAALPERARQIFVLFHLAEHSHAEIAELLGVDVGTSKAQVHRARQLLQEALQ